MTKRADKKRNVDKVAAELAKNPLATERELAKETGVSKSAVNRAKKEVGRSGVKDDRIVHLTDKDFELMQLIQSEKERRLYEEKDKINNCDINRWEETAVKRYTLFRGDATDEKGGAKENTISWEM